MANIMELGLQAGKGDPSMPEQADGELSFFTCESVSLLCCALPSAHPFAYH